MAEPRKRPPESPERSPCKRCKEVSERHLCSLGTGEAVHVLMYKAKPSHIDEFELTVQSLARDLYALESAVTDVRVCHPKCGEVVFVVTFVSRAALDDFARGPQMQFERSLRGMCLCAESRDGDGGCDITSTSGGGSGDISGAGGSDGCTACFRASGSLMPAAHTLDSLLEYLKANIRGKSSMFHNVRAVSSEMEMWFPRPSEWQRFLRGGEDEGGHGPGQGPASGTGTGTGTGAGSSARSKPPATGYTRHLVYGNEHMDVILMHWPAGSRSTIHDHEDSSCWVNIVDGSVHEVQYAVPRLDRKFLEAEARDPATATGHCGPLKQLSVTQLDTHGCVHTYANNDIGLHRVENRTDAPAATLHVYAPPLKKMRIYTEDGRVRVHVASTRCCDELLEHDPGASSSCVSSECIFDVDAWNNR
eukprot:g1996.t1